MRAISYLCIAIVSVYLLGSASADLTLGFYSKSCPKAETIVQDYVNKHIPNAPSLAAALIRMNFHDCFVEVRITSFLFSLVDQMFIIRIYWFVIMWSYIYNDDQTRVGLLIIIDSGMWCINFAELYKEFRQPNGEACNAKFNRSRVRVYWWNKELNWSWMSRCCVLCRYYCFGCKRLRRPYCKNQKPTKLATFI